MPYKIAMTIIKLFYLECGTDHIANYMNFTTAPAFRLNPYPYEEDLAKYGIDQ
jgi:hypothetical protein